MLNCCRMSLPRTTEKMLTTVLNNTIYKLKIGQGLSARTYMSNDLRQILGTSQGSCASPFILITILDFVLWYIANKYIYICFRLVTPTGAGIDRIGETSIDNSAIVCLSQDPDFTSTKTIQNCNKHMESITQDFE